MEIKDKLRHNFPWDISIFPVRLRAPQGCGRSDERMAELENCMRCGGLYVMDRFHYCNDCMKWFTETCGAVKDYLRKHPNVVKAVVQASQKGWSYYLDNYESVNPFIQTYNRDMTVEAMNYEAEQEKPFVLNDETKVSGIGYMTPERWNLIQEQLLQIGGLKDEQDVSKAFTTEYLTKP